LGQGRDAVKDLIKDNPELMDELEAKIKAAVDKTEDARLDKVEPNIADDGEPD
jgi:recombination protein RecA